MVLKSVRRLSEFAVSLEQQVERFLAMPRNFVVVVLVLTAGLVARWASIALSVPTVGPDYGHYLIAANWYAGIDRSGEGPFDPPFVPMLVLVLAPAFGKITALQLLGSVALAAIFPAAVYFMSRFVPRWAALLASAAFAQWQTFAEFITYGGVTNLFGIAFSLVFFRLFYQALDAPHVGWRPCQKDLLVSALLFVIVSTHHLTALVVGVTVLVWVAFHLLLGTRNRLASAWTALRVIGIGSLLSLVYVPYLLSLVTTDTMEGFGEPTPLATLVDIIAFVWTATPGLWVAFLVLALAAVLRFSRSSPVLPATGALALTPWALVLTVLASHAVRVMFFLEFPLVFLASFLSVPGSRAGSLHRRLGASRAIGGSVFVALLAGALLVLPGSSVAAQLEGMRYYHSFMDVHTLEAFDWVDRNTAPASIFAADAGTSATFNDAWKGMATGWWLEGYANRRAIYKANPTLLPFLSKWADARDANRLFAGDTIFEDGILRVADGFPLDDAAVPKVYTAYLQDYHEFVGFAVPRVVNTSTQDAYTLVLGADSNFRRDLVGGVGTISGNYSGPGFVGTRSSVYDYRNETVTLEIRLTFNPTASWDAFEMTVRLPPWTEVNLSLVDQGVIVCRVPEFSGFRGETGRVELTSSNLSLPSQVPQIGTPGEGGIGLRWLVQNRIVTLRATVVLTKQAGGSSQHAPTMYTADQILSNHAVDFLFVTTESASNIQRFDRQPSRFTRVFANPSVVIFLVH